MKIIPITNIIKNRSMVTKNMIVSFQLVTPLAYTYNVVETPYKDNSSHAEIYT